jgi:hypothetical protein
MLALAVRGGSVATGAPPTPFATFNWQRRVALASPSLTTLLTAEQRGQQLRQPRPRRDEVPVEQQLDGDAVVGGNDGASGI